MTRDIVAELRESARFQTMRPEETWQWEAAEEIARLSQALASADRALYAYRHALEKHWLTGVHCDETTKTDVATCYCTTWRSKPQPNVRDAVKAWIAHVEECAAFSAPTIIAREALFPSLVMALREIAAYCDAYPDTANKAPISALALGYIALADPLVNKL